MNDLCKNTFKANNKEPNIRLLSNTLLFEDVPCNYFLIKWLVVRERTKKSILPRSLHASSTRVARMV